MTVTCPEGHQSEATDYCDTCGSPIGAGASAGASAGGPGSGASSGGPGAGAAAGPSLPGQSSPGSVLDLDGAAGPATQTCPHCGGINLQDALFCEACGYDFTTGAAPLDDEPAGDEPIGDEPAGDEPSDAGGAAGDEAAGDDSPDDPLSVDDPVADHEPASDDDSAEDDSAGVDLAGDGSADADGSADGATAVADDLVAGGGSGAAAEADSVAPTADETPGPVSGPEDDSEGGEAEPSGEQPDQEGDASSTEQPEGSDADRLGDASPDAPHGGEDPDAAEPDDIPDPSPAPAQPHPVAHERPRHAPPSRALSDAWVVEVWVDPDWYAVQQTEEACPSPAVPDIVLVRRNVVLIGRPSGSLGVRPDVDAGADSAVSRRHAQLTSDGRRWWIEDLGSSNGTFLGVVGEPMPSEAITPGQRVEIDRDDRIYLGAWTRLVLRPATDSEQAGQG